jgi:O-antigen/teichoic acid export membrane protein
LSSTIYAHLTYVFVFYSLFQWLGFYGVYINLINSLQRADVGGIGSAVIVPLVTLIQIILVPIFFQMGRANPNIGAALGGAIGSALSNFVANILVFFGTWLLFRKTFGFSGTTLFRVDFDGEITKDMFKFGIKIAPGRAIIPLIAMIQIVLLSVYLDNYNSWMGYWGIAIGIANIASMAGLFAGMVIPALSEAKENNKQILVTYDVASSMKWMNNFTFGLSAALLAISIPLIRALSPIEFQSTARLMPLLIIYTTFIPIAGLGDAIFSGLNYPFYISLASGIEQVSKLILLLLFIPLFAIDPTIGIFAVVFALIPSIILKDISAFIIVKKKIIPDLKFYPFKVWIAPGLAGVAFFFITYLVLTGLGILLGVLLGPILSALISTLIVAVFVFTMGPSIQFFFSGLFGGWSSDGLEEFKRSISVMTIGGKFGSRLYNSCRAGAKLSPWREKGTIDSYKEARIEAWELTLEKKKLLRM